MADDQSISFKPEDFHPVEGEFSFAPSAFQPLDDKGEAPVSKPAPAQTKGLDLPGNMAIRTAQPSVWDRISNVFTSGIPSLSSRTSTNPKYGQMQLVSPEEAMTPGEQERHPVLRATGEVAGGFTSPQSIALIAATAALGARHALGGKGAITGRTSEAGETVPVETHPVDPQSPVGTLIQGQPAPDVRLVETEAQRTELEQREQATGWKDIPPQRVNPQEVADVSRALGRPVTEEELPGIRRGLEAERNVEEGLKGNRRDVAGEIREAHRATLESKNGNRVVTDEHVPVVTKSEVLAERIQRMVDNSEELAKIGLDPAKITTVDDVQAQLEKAADHLKQNLDPRVTDTLTFDMQRKLAGELGMSVEDLLSRKSGASFNAEEVTAARSLLKASQTRVLDLARKAASGEVEPRAMTDALAQHKGILD